MKCLDVSFFSCWTLDTLKVTSYLLYYSTLIYISLAGCLVVDLFGLWAYTNKGMFFTPDYLFLLLPLHFYKYANLPFAAVQPMNHMGLKHASREKKMYYGNFLIFVHKNVYRIRFQKIKIGP